MLIATIRENKNNYYIHMEKTRDTSSYHVICANNENTFSMNNEEILEFFVQLFQSNLTFYKKIENYDVFLDEAGNKRFF